MQGKYILEIRKDLEGKVKYQKSGKAQFMKLFGMDYFSGCCAFPQLVLYGY